jgi:gamma-glutamyltranspeptidase
MNTYSAKDSLGAVASGHPLTSRAACEMLRRGGNAFDAVVAAAFAATVTEPCLASLGGGGFLLVHNTRSGEDVLYDFFVNTPGLGREASDEPSLEAVDIHFVSSSQVFHVGAASVAVPGVLKGLMESYVELCSLEIEDILEPALGYLLDGVEFNELNKYLFRILKPILSRTDYGREIFAGKESGGTFFNPRLNEFLKERSCEKWFDAVYGEGAGRLEAQLADGGGLLTGRDLFEYQVVMRYYHQPAAVVWRFAAGNGVRFVKPAGYSGNERWRALSGPGRHDGHDEPPSRRDHRHYAHQRHRRKRQRRSPYHFERLELRHLPRRYGHHAQ